MCLAIKDTLQSIDDKILEINRRKNKLDQYLNESASNEEIQDYLKLVTDAIFEMADMYRVRYCSEDLVKLFRNNDHLNMIQSYVNKRKHTRVDHKYNRYPGIREVITPGGIVFQMGSSIRTTVDGSVRTTEDGLVRVTENEKIEWESLYNECAMELNSFFDSIDAISKKFIIKT